jgi:hypothetical protein
MQPAKFLEVVAEPATARATERCVIRSGQVEIAFEMIPEVTYLSSLVCALRADSE